MMLLELLERLSAAATTPDNGQLLVHLRVPETTPLGFAIFSMIVLGFIATVVVLEILRRKRELLQRIVAQWQAFDQLAAHKGLTEEELDLLREIHEAQSGDVAPDAILRLASVYDRSIDEWMAALQQEGARPSVAQWEHLARIRSCLGFNTLSSETRLSHTRQIPVGQVLRVWAASVPGKATHAEVVENHETELRLSWHDAALSVPVGENLSFSFSRMGDGEYRAEVPVISAFTEGVSVAQTARLSRQQLRMWVRVPVALEGSVYGLTSMDGQISEERMPVRLMDLSGGGAMIATPHSIAVETRGLMELELGGVQISDIPFLLLRQGAVMRDNWQIGHLCFDGIETSAQERIMRYVFERQRAGSGKST
jgi:hypothetical protein